MKRMIALLMTAVLCAGLMPAGAELSGKENTDYESLCGLAAQYGFKLGGCFSFNQRADKAYMDVMARHFNSITCTNETKAYSLLDQRMSKAAEDGMPRMNFKNADRMIEWAQANGVSVRGHVLVWDAYMTTWFFHEGYDNNKPFADTETMRARLKSYIEQVITHFETNYPGVIYCWDVVNEAIGDNIGEYRADDERHIRTVRSGATNLFLDHVGDDYVEYSFLCAKDTVKALGADIKLFYNDYNMFSDGKLIPALKLVKSINSYAQNEEGKNRKLIDGIGMQGYIGGYGTQSGCLNDKDIDLVERAIRLYAKAGMQVHITEMAVRNYEEDRAAEHAAYYAKLFRMFMSINTEESAPLTAVCIWGINDIPVRNAGNEYSWKLNSPFGGLLTERNQIKTSFDSIYHALKGE